MKDELVIGFWMVVICFIVGFLAYALYDELRTIIDVLRFASTI